jgi:hypothetical protein
LDHFLSEGVHAVQVREDIVFLDTLADSYFCLGGVADVIALGEGGRIEVRHEESAAQLLEAGLVSREPRGWNRPAPPRATRSALWRPPKRPASLARLVAAVTTNGTVGRRLARRAFDDLLEPALAPESLLAEPSADLLEAVAQFEQVRPWLPLRGECLARSYQLRAFLRARGFDAFWVFGVRTWPFSAHCWLQVGTTALDEHLERLTAFFPILAV